MDIKVLQEKFCEYKELMNWFYIQGILRTDNLVGSYAEYLLSDKLNLELCDNSSKDVDAIEIVDNREIRYQIKSRRLNGREDGLKMCIRDRLFTRLNPNRKLRLERERLAREEAAKHPELNEETEQV